MMAWSLKASQADSVPSFKQRTLHPAPGATPYAGHWRSLPAAKDEAMTAPQESSSKKKLSPASTFSRAACETSMARDLTSTACGAVLSWASNATVALLNLRVFLEQVFPELPSLRLRRQRCCPLPPQGLRQVTTEATLPINRGHLDELASSQEVSSLSIGCLQDGTPQIPRARDMTNQAEGRHRRAGKTLTWFWEAAISSATASPRVKLKSNMGVNRSQRTSFRTPSGADKAVAD